MTPPPKVFIPSVWAAAIRKRIQEAADREIVLAAKINREAGKPR